MIRDILDFFKKNRFTILPLMVFIIGHALLYCFVYLKLGQGFNIYIDQAAYINKKVDFSMALSLWSPNNLGNMNGLYVVVNFMGRLFSLIFLKILPTIKSANLFFYFFISVLISSSAFLCFLNIQKVIFKITNPLYPFIAAALYSFNFSAITNTGILDNNFHIYIVAPILLLMTISQLEHRDSLRNIITEGISLGLILNNIPFSTALLITIYVPFAFAYIRTLKELIFFIKRYVLISIVSLSVAFFFLFCLFYTSKSLSNGALSSTGNAVGYIFLSNGISGLFQLIFDWTIQLYNFDKYHHPYYNYFLGNIGFFASYSLWFVLLSVLIESWNRINHKRVILYLLLSLVIALFLIKGNQAPFSTINILFYKINPVMNVLKTPSSKFALVIMLYISTLILIGLNISNKRSLTLFVFILVIILILPYFNLNRFLNKINVNGEKYVAYFENEQVQLINLLNEAKKEGALLMYPGSYAGHYRTSMGDFMSQDLIGKMIDRPVIYDNENIMSDAARVIRQISLKSFEPNLVGSKSIRYILVRSDYSDLNLDQINEIKIHNKILSSNIGYRLTYKSKHYALYELKEKYYQNILSYESSDPAFNSKRVKYIKVSPTEYEIFIDPKEVGSGKLTFNQSFSSDWVAKDQSGQLIISKYTNTKFGNIWKIMGNTKLIKYSNQPIRIQLYFFPQKVANITLLVSSCAIIFMICVYNLVTYLKKLEIFIYT